MRFLSANLIFPIYTDPIANGILAISANGTIKNLMLPDDPNAPEKSRVEHFNGFLCPGFVNAHCHLELSHMKGVVPEKTGLPKFIVDIVTKREENSEQKLDKIKLADEEMWSNGIQAVGDICNTADTVETKANSRIVYHSFVEVFSFDSSRANEVLEEGKRVAAIYKQNKLAVTIVPHAPYSVSEELFKGIRAQQSRFPGPISMHNQETESENEMFVSGSGDLVETFKKFGEYFSDFNPSFKSSLDYSFPLLIKGQNLLLVHNTLTTPSEFNQLHSLRDDVFWCTCPQANKYIENQLPNIPMWIEKRAKICVGTDSLASNHQLSVLEELKLISKSYPETNLAKLLQIATINGAEALNMEDKIGSFNSGKIPGVVLIKNVDTNELRLTNETVAQRII